MTTPLLTAPGIVLRPLLLSDAPALFIALGDPEVQLYRRAAAHESVRETQIYIRRTLNTSRAAWAITADGHEAVGRLALRTPEPSVGEFGIVIRRDSQRRGFGRKALALAADYAFTTLGLSALRADIDAENAPSLALFRAAGFTGETFMPGHRVTKLGVRDSIILEMNRPPNYRAGSDD